VKPEVRVYVVDDEPAMRQGLTLLLGSVGLPCETYASADEFLKGYDPAVPGCLVLDIRLPGPGGLQLQETLIRLGHDLPIIMLTAYGTISMAVRAVKAGAFDFVEKPFREQDLLDRIQQAVQHDLATREQRARRSQIARLLASLSAREREVLDLVVEGHSNKVIAAKLSLSHKTIEYHRAKIMEKLKLDSIPELVQFAMLGRTSNAR